MQVLVSRETSPLGTAVVSITKLAAGEGAYDVIPDSANFGGTLRSLSHDHLMYLKQRMEEVRCHWPLLCCACLCSKEGYIGYVKAAKQNHA